MKKYRSSLIWGAVLAALVMAPALVTAPAGAAEIDWKLGSPVGPQDLATKYLNIYAQRVGERSGGRLAIEVIPIETLGFKNVDSLRVVKQNVVDSIYVQTFYVTRDEPLMGAFMPHGVLTDPKENLKVLDVQFDIVREILKDKWGMELITRDPTGGGQSRLLVVSKDPVSDLDTLRKLKFRHYSKAGIRAYSKLGVSAQVIPSSELYLALQTGVVDGAMYGAPYILSQSLNEVTCCASFVGALTLSPRGIAADATKWANLPQDLRQIMLDVGEEMFDESMALWNEEKIYKAAEAKLTESGYKVLDAFPLEDRVEIQQAILDVWREDVEKIGPQALGYYERIVAALRAGI
jgi:TRAP-type C4-dicarboxylate transport system substrate-binding protein